MRQLTLLLIGILISTFPKAAIGHGSESHYLLVNGQYTQNNPIQGLAPDLLPLNTTTETFVAGTPIQFEIDLKNLGFDGGVRWRWSKNETGYEEGTKVSHTYPSPGSYFVTIQVRGQPTNNEFTDYNSVRLNVAPKENYVAPSIKVMTESKDGGGKWDVIYKAEVAKDPSATIKSYKWVLGDGSKAEGQLIQHSYQKGFYQAFPFVVVTDSNGLMAALAFQVDENGGKFNASSLPSSPNTIIAGVASQAIPFWVYLIIPLAGLVIVAVLLLKKGKIKRP